MTRPIASFFQTFMIPVTSGATYLPVGQIPASHLFSDENILCVGQMTDHTTCYVPVAEKVPNQVIKNGQGPVRWANDSYAPGTEHYSPAPSPLGMRKPSPIQATHQPISGFLPNGADSSGGGSPGKT